MAVSIEYEGGPAYLPPEKVLDLIEECLRGREGNRGGKITRREKCVAFHPLIFKQLGCFLEIGPSLDLLVVNGILGIKIPESMGLTREVVEQAANACYQEEEVFYGRIEIQPDGFVNYRYFPRLTNHEECAKEIITYAAEMAVCDLVRFLKSLGATLALSKVKTEIPQ